MGTPKLLIHNMPNSFIHMSIYLIKLIRKPRHSLFGVDETFKPLTRTLSIDSLLNYHENSKPISLCLPSQASFRCAWELPCSPPESLLMWVMNFLIPLGVHVCVSSSVSTSKPNLEWRSIPILQSQHNI